MKYVKMMIYLPEEVYNNMVVKNEYTSTDIIAVHNALMGAIILKEDGEEVANDI